MVAAWLVNSIFISDFICTNLLLLLPTSDKAGISTDTLEQVVSLGEDCSEEEYEQQVATVGEARTRTKSAASVNTST